jgi:hypothetical protein
MKNRLIHLIYASVATKKLTETEVAHLLTDARNKNSLQHITGMLLYTHPSFFQLLEGEETLIHDLYQVIKKDPRHSKATIIIEEPISERLFPQWTMGFSDPSTEELSSIEGMNDFFTNDQHLTQLKPSRAKKLLQAFSSGRWHLA